MACKSRVPVIMNALLFVALLAQTLAVDVAASARSTHTLKLVSRRHQHKLKSSLKDGQILKSRESMVDGDLLLMMQEDCNLVLYKQNLTTGAIAVVWNTSTQSNNIDLCFLKMQHDGNLVIYLTTPGHKEKTTPYWETASAGAGIPPYILKFVPVDEASKFSGGVAIYDRDWKRTWSSFQNVGLK